MCKGGGALGFDRASRTERWGVATEAEMAAALQTPGLVYLDTRTDDEVKESPPPASIVDVCVHCKTTTFSAKQLEQRAAELCVHGI